jgi:peptidyl-prolyl cis-trans isomerase C
MSLLIAHYEPIAKEDVLFKKANCMTPGFSGLFGSGRVRSSTIHRSSIETYFGVTLTKRMMRYALVAAVTSAMSLPLIAQIKSGNNSSARPDPGVPLPNLLDAPPAAAQPATQPAVDPAKVIITVGESKITAGDFNTFLSDLDPNTQAQVLSRPDGKRKLAEEMVKLKLLSAEARRRKLEDAPRTRMVYEQLLANALLTDMAEQKGADEKFFNDHKDFFEELKARHILIAVEGSGVPGAKLTDSQAKAKVDAIEARLKKGEDFAAIAKAESDDKASGAQGGNLGQVARGMMVPPFEQAAFALKKGEISQPVKTQFGYHIIQVMDRTPVTFEQARQRVPMRRLDVLVDELKQATKPEIDEGFFGPDAKAQTGAVSNAAQPAAARIEHR